MTNERTPRGYLKNRMTVSALKRALWAVRPPVPALRDGRPSADAALYRAKENGRNRVEG